MRVGHRTTFPLSKITVYLSSAFRDLEEYRRQVLGYFATMEDRFRVINMEKYTAEDKITYRKCMEDVKNCNLYILLLGKSYGSIARDPDDPEFNKAEGYSYTHYEYLQAKADRAAGKTEIMIFKAEDEAPLPAKDPEGKLKKFIESEVAGRLAGTFTSPFDLEIQLNRALANRYFKVPSYDWRLAYKCDRYDQTQEFALKVQGLRTLAPTAAESRFRAVILYGDEEALGGNLVNKLSLFDLALDEKRFVAPLSLTQISRAEPRDGTLRKFLRYIYTSLGGMPERGDYSVASLIDDIQQKESPVALIMDGPEEMFDAEQMAFLQQFLQACHAECKRPNIKPLYFFFFLQEAKEARPVGKIAQFLSRWIPGRPKQSGTAAGKIAQFLNGMPNADEFVIPLPRLSVLVKEDVRNWVRKEISPDAGTRAVIMKDYFEILPETDVTMLEADTAIKAFLKAMNDRDPRTTAYLNLY